MNRNSRATDGLIDPSRPTRQRELRCQFTNCYIDGIRVGNLVNWHRNSEKANENNQYKIDLADAFGREFGALSDSQAINIGVNLREKAYSEFFLKKSVQYLGQAASTISGMTLNKEYGSGWSKVLEVVNGAYTDARAELVRRDWEFTKEFASLYIKTARSVYTIPNAIVTGYEVTQGKATSLDLTMALLPLSRIRKLERFATAPRIPGEFKVPRVVSSRAAPFQVSGKGVATLDARAPITPRSVKVTYGSVPGGGANRGVHNVLESSSKSPRAQAYEDAIPGTVYDIAPRKRVTPALRFDNPNPRGRPEVRFDGVDQANPSVLTERKLNATTRTKQVGDIQRWAEALKQNPGYSVRIEVPDRTAYRNVVRLIDRAGAEKSPITVRIVP